MDTTKYKNRLGVGDGYLLELVTDISSFGGFLGETIGFLVFGTV